MYTNVNFDQQLVYLEFIKRKGMFNFSTNESKYRAYT